MLKIGKIFYVVVWKIKFYELIVELIGLVLLFFLVMCGNLRERIEW